jgi:two-component system, NtrC family, response regulator HydG
MSGARVLVVDDDGEMADMLVDHLAGRGYRAEAAAGGKAALAAMKKREFDAVITDLRMDGVDGLDVLEAVRGRWPVLLMTAYGSIDGAVEAVRRGAYHYLTKPFKLDEATLWLERALTDGGLRRENERLKKSLGERYAFSSLVGKSPIMRQLYDLLERVGATAAPVLITGESGTGKELVARAVHQASARASAPFVAVNCTALPESLLESELFGHARGAFTGATEAKRGLFAEADGGTLFLDEIGDMSLPLQAKLLRVLESGTVRPVGGSGERRADARIIAATHRDLGAAVRERRFREDLYYRLHVLPVQLPPLRARREDIPLYIEHFSASVYARNPSLPRREWTAEAVRRLTELPWPGNVRELRNLVERLLLLGRKRRIDLADLAGALPEPIPEAMAGLASDIVPLRLMQRRYVEWVIAQAGGNKLRAAQLLEIDASTIYRMLARDDE